MCMGSQLPISLAASVTTCNNCDYLAPGESCYLACLDPSMTMSGMPEITCANGTWAFAGLPPTCNPVLATCPPIMNINSGHCTNNGIIVQPNSTCVGAVEGDVCNISCQAGYAVPPTAAHVARCHWGSWTDMNTGAPVVLECAAQALCVANTGTFTGDTCVGEVCPTTPSANFGSVAAGSLLRR
jgi:hypothetical protein